MSVQNAFFVKKKVLKTKFKNNKFGITFWGSDTDPKLVVKILDSDPQHWC
jgi:hypothetical protein